MRKFSTQLQRHSNLSVSTHSRNITCHKKCIKNTSLYQATQTRHSHAVANPYSILIYGDSNTWGFDPDCTNRSPTQRFAYKDRWTTILQRNLGSHYHVIPEGLNSRTTTHSDTSPPPCDGDYDCNGRATLSAILHSHKPLNVVVLALGANDFKLKFASSPHDIVAGIRVLIRDIQKMSAIGYLDYEHQDVAIQGKKCGALADIKPPHIVVLSPPIMKSTPLNRLWGFEDKVEMKSRKLLGLLSVVCKDLKVSYVNIAGSTTVSELDGVHFTKESQPIIADAVTDKIRELINLKYK